MKKGILCAVIGCCLFTSGVFASSIYKKFIAEEVDYVIEIDGRQENFMLPIVTIDDNTYIALRQLCGKIGYEVNWIGEERRIELSSSEKILLPFYDEMNKSKEDILSDGTKYNYIAIDDFSYIDQTNQWGAVSAKSRYGEVPTAKIAAEIGRIVLGYDKNNSDVTLQVYFDIKKDAWFVYGLVNDTTHSGLKAIAIQRKDGKIIEKYELR